MRTLDLDTWGSLNSCIQACFMGSQSDLTTALQVPETDPSPNTKQTAPEETQGTLGTTGMDMHVRTQHTCFHLLNQHKAISKPKDKWVGQGGGKLELISISSEVY